MMKRLAALVLCVLFAGNTWASEGQTLDIAGKTLGRVEMSELPPSFQLSFALGEDTPLATHVTARFQTNRPLQKTAVGDWIDWNEQANSLVDLGLTPESDGTLTFTFTKDALPTAFLPAVITLAYQTERGMKSGYLVIDP